MTNLIDELKVLLATNVSFKIKAQNFHWNVEGANFIQYHDMLGTIYTTAESNTDTIAEHIRALDMYTPGSLKRFAELSLISDEENIPEALQMFIKLRDDHKIYTKQLSKVHDAAVTAKQHGVVNFIEGLIDAAVKLDWMLRSITKK